MFLGDLCCCGYCSFAHLCIQTEELSEFAHHDTGTQVQQSDCLAWVGKVTAMTMRFAEAPPAKFGLIALRGCFEVLTLISLSAHVPESCRHSKSLHDKSTAGASLLLHSVLAFASSQLTTSGFLGTEGTSSVFR